MKSEIDIDILICRCLAGEATLSEEERLTGWIEASDDNLKHFLQMKNMWDITGQKQDFSLPFSRIICGMEGKENRPAGSNSRNSDIKQHYWGKAFRFSAAAAFLFMSMLSAYLVYDKFSTVDDVTYTEVTTPYGSKSTFTLPDGSQVCLNSGSAIKYASNMSDAEERVVNVEGEAFFKVKSDKEHPFIVNAGNLKVTATGTSFNVRSYETSSREHVALLDGVVDVVSGDWNCTLEPGQTAVFDKSCGSSVIDLSSAADFCSWVEGKLVFSGVKLSDILDRLEEVYSVEIILDGSVENCTCYATFSNESIDRILTLLSHIVPIKYSWIDTHRVEVVPSNSRNNN